MKTEKLWGVAGGEGTNRAQRALTSFMRRTPLTTTPRRQPSMSWRLNEKSYSSGDCDWVATVFVVSSRSKAALASRRPSPGH